MKNTEQLTDSVRILISKKEYDQAFNALKSEQQEKKMISILRSTYQVNGLPSQDNKEADDLLRAWLPNLIRFIQKEEEGERSGESLARLLSQIYAPEDVLKTLIESLGDAWVRHGYLSNYLEFEEKPECWIPAFKVIPDLLEQIMMEAQKEWVVQDIRHQAMKKEDIVGYVDYRKPHWALTLAQLENPKWIERAFTAAKKEGFDVSLLATLPSGPYFYFKELGPLGWALRMGKAEMALAIAKQAPELNVLSIAKSLNRAVRNPQAPRRRRGEKQEATAIAEAITLSLSTPPSLSIESKFRL